MKRLALALPVLGLILQCDRLASQPPAPAPYVVKDVRSVLPALPPRSEGRYGKPGDALNIVILGTEPQVRAALSSAGWSEIPLSIAQSVQDGAVELWSGRTLTRFPPMQGYRLNYRLMERTQDMNWAQVIVPMETRHHFRLWRTGVADKDGRELWWGSGDFDESLRLWDLSHRPSPDTDLERDYLARSLEKSALVERTALLALPQIPRRYVNDNRYEFHDDGRALFVELKP